MKRVLSTSKGYAWIVTVSEIYGHYSSSQTHGGLCLSGAEKRTLRSTDNISTYATALMVPVNTSKATAQHQAHGQGSESAAQHIRNGSSGSRDVYERVTRTVGDCPTAARDCPTAARDFLCFGPLAAWRCVKKCQSRSWVDMATECAQSCAMGYTWKEQQEVALLCC